MRPVKSVSFFFLMDIATEFTETMRRRGTTTDIEDKGTSGQTFLAAVEYLEQEQPSVALFENVENAPWEKMQEYIRGRLHLSERNSLKNITGAKKASEYLIFGLFPIRPLDNYHTTNCTRMLCP